VHDVEFRLETGPEDADVVALLVDGAPPPDLARPVEQPSAEAAGTPGPAGDDAPLSFASGDRVRRHLGRRRFRQGHRDGDLSALGPFVFDRAQDGRALADVELPDPRPPR
jgi:hypothetical protein